MNYKTVINTQKMIKNYDYRYLDIKIPYLVLKIDKSVVIGVDVKNEILLKTITY